MSWHPAAFHVMIKPCGAKCNLNCTYCFYLPKLELYPDSQFHMDDSTLENFIRQYITAQKIPQAIFGWQGGEPTTLGLDFFQKIIEIQKKYTPPNFKIENTLQTNGTLIDDKWAKFLHDNHFLVGLSLDGPAELHDPYRVDKGNQPSHGRVIKAWNILRKYKVETNILCCVQALNVTHPLEVYRYFRDNLRVQFIQFIPIVNPNPLSETTDDKIVSDQSITGKQYGDFLTAIFDEWIHHDVGNIFVQLFDVTLAAWMNEPAGLCVYSKTCGTALALEHNGDLYSCDHFVGLENKLGNINETDMRELIETNLQKQFGLNKYTTLPQKCKSCSVLFACYGGCPKDRIILIDEKEPRLNFLCDGYYAFFRHVDRYMQMMANLLRAGQPANMIMQMLN